APSSFFIFFFSSRRRHTRFSRDWSSDVCSSDLALGTGCIALGMLGLLLRGTIPDSLSIVGANGVLLLAPILTWNGMRRYAGRPRSEERRGGKGCRAGAAAARGHERRSRRRRMSA